MKNFIIAVLTILVIVGGKFALHAQGPMTSLPVATGCDSTLWNHVYAGDPKKFRKPQDRLKVINDCITVTGTLFSIKKEADGDMHIRVTLDPQFKSLLNAKNISGQKGKFVIEPVCQTAPTQKDTIAEGVCKNYHQNLVIPAVGTHVSITGVYILDMEHGWNEIHPITSITPIK